MYKRKLHNFSTCRPVKKKEPLERKKIYGIAGHIINQFNNKETADFIIQDKTGDSLYLHKLILGSNEYFKTYFESKMVENKNKMMVESVKTVTILAKFFYGDCIDIPNDMSGEDFFEMIDLSKMWHIFNDICCSLLLDYAQKNWQRIVKENINYACLFFLHFEYENEYPGYDEEILGNSEYAKKMIKEITTYLENNLELIPLEMLENDYFLKNVSNNTKLAIITRYSQFHIISADNPINLYDARSIFRKYYDAKKNIFTEKQMASLCSANYINYDHALKLIVCKNNCDLITCNNCNDMLIISTLVPFVAKHYIALGYVNYVPEIDGLEIESYTNFKINDEIYDSESNVHKIKTLHWYDKKVTRGFNGNTYYLTFTDDKLFKYLKKQYEETKKAVDLCIWKINN